MKGISEFETLVRSGVDINFRRRRGKRTLGKLRVKRRGIKEQNEAREVLAYRSVSPSFSLIIA